jgi:hypothetical protein
MGEEEATMREQAESLLLVELMASERAIPFPGDPFREAAIRAIMEALRSGRSAMLATLRSPKI